MSIKGLGNFSNGETCVFHHRGDGPNEALSLRTLEQEKTCRYRLVLKALPLHRIFTYAPLK